MGDHANTATTITDDLILVAARTATAEHVRRHGPRSRDHLLTSAWERANHAARTWEPSQAHGDPYPWLVQNARWGILDETRRIATHSRWWWRILERDGQLPARAQPPLSIDARAPGSANAIARFGDWKRYDAPADDVLPAHHEPGYTRVEDTATLTRLLACLNPRQRHVIIQFYFRDRPIFDIGADLGVTESRASQIHHDALRKMRKHHDAWTPTAWAA